ncbi:permease [Rubrobacter tropicus]|uniref:permease n=1 Tax=Rubrobacter tropicus TaxID=2653851 RepID=UPI00140D24E4|nr:permease [Rubrobacter tropicus]
MIADSVHEAARIGGFVGSSALKILPVFLLSVSLGVLVRALKLDGAIRRAFDARVGVAIVLATAVGAFSPFCSCTVVPLVAGLLVAGVPLAPVMAFWVASPTMDPEVFALSVGMIGWPLAVARLLATLFLSLGAGYLTLALARGGILRGKVLRRGAAEKYEEDDATDSGGCCESPAPREAVLVSVARKPAGGAEAATDEHRAWGAEPGEEACGTRGCGDDPNVGKSSGWWGQIVGSLRGLDRPRFAKEVLAQSWPLGRWLLLAFAIEALILFYVPQQTIAGVLGGESAFAVPIAALVGLPLYLNEFGALPIVAGLLDSGMSPGAAIAFLVAGPVTTIPAMAAVWGIVRPRVFALYVGVGLGGAVLMGLITDLLL